MYFTDINIGDAIGKFPWIIYFVVYTHHELKQKK